MLLWKVKNYLHDTRSMGRNKSANKNKVKSLKGVDLSGEDEQSNFDGAFPIHTWSTSGADTDRFFQRQTAHSKLKLRTTQL